MLLPQRIYIYIFVRADSVSSLLGQHGGFLSSVPPPTPARDAKNRFNSIQPSKDGYLTDVDHILGNPISNPLTLVNTSSLLSLSSSHFGNAGC